jgi:hypothetical protein
VVGALEAVGKKLKYQKENHLPWYTAQGPAAKIVLEEELNQILNQLPRVRSKTAVCFIETAQSMTEREVKGEREGAHAHCGRGTEHRRTRRGIIKRPAKSTTQ